MTPLECEIIVGSIPAGAISRKGGSIWGMSANNTVIRLPEAATPEEDEQLIMETGLRLAEEFLKNPPLAG